MTLLGVEENRQVHFELVPFHFPKPPLSDLTPPNIHISGTIQIKQTTLKIQYRVSGEDVLRILWPEDSSQPEIKDDLWRSTCFEMFMATKFDPGYLEYNFSPSRDWAMFAFTKYRDRKEFGDMPDLHIRNGCIDSKILTEVSFIIDSEYQDKHLDVGMSAIIETVEGDIFYYALAHDGNSPDFHIRNTFMIDI